MRLLQYNSTGKLSLASFSNNNLPPYAILSHTWGDENEEILYRNVVEETYEDKKGYRKIRFCGEQASRDGLQYFWVDTCCIDKSSSAELSEAILRMFSWYRGAEKCYVYLSDVSTAKRKRGNPSPGPLWERAFRGSRWFTRGWTLQELIAPVVVEFFSADCVLLGDRASLKEVICDITGIHINAIQGKSLSSFSVSERIRWIQKRETKVEEDKVYSLLGIFGVQIPLLYGEGEEKAFTRLLRELKNGQDGEQIHCLIRI